MKINNNNGRLGIALRKNLKKRKLFQKKHKKINDTKRQAN